MFTGIITDVGTVVAAGGFAFAGQSCISVQRVYVHANVFDAFSRRLVALVEALTAELLGRRSGAAGNRGGSWNRTGPRRGPRYSRMAGVCPMTRLPSTRNGQAKGGRGCDSSSR